MCSTDFTKRDIHTYVHTFCFLHVLKGSKPIENDIERFITQNSSQIHGLIHHTQLKRHCISGIFISRQISTTQENDNWRINMKQPKQTHCINYTYPKALTLRCSTRKLRDRSTGPNWVYSTPPANYVTGVLALTRFTALHPQITWQERRPD